MTEEYRVVIDLALLLLISGILSLVFVKIKMPPILGYVAAGVVLGPSMFPDLWVENNTVDVLSSIGIVLLMFYIGLEMDVRKLKAEGSKLLFVVSLQMPMMVAFGFLAGIALGMTAVQAIFLGAIISGTSTAVVVGVLRGSKHITPEMARTIITITIFEDVGQVLILTLAAPLLAGDSPALGSTVNMIVGLILFIGLTIVIGMALVPKALNYIGDRFSPEILLIVAVGLCFAMAALSSEVGLSIAIGAFLMGLIISLSKYNRVLATKVEPTKELFMAVFFISIGLQITPMLIFENLWLVAVIAVVFIIGKIVSIWMGCYLMNMTAKDSLMIATSLIAMGEFAFVIAQAAYDADVVSQGFYSAVVGAAILTMVLMPMIDSKQPKMYDWAVRAMPDRLRCALVRIDDIHAVVERNTRIDQRTKREIKKDLTLIVIDILVMLIILITFTSVESVTSSITDAATGLALLPQELLLIAMLIVLAPVVYNWFMNVRRITRTMTRLVMESPKGGGMNERTVFLIFANLSNITFILALAVVMVPFMPKLVFSPLGIISVFIGAGIVIYLLWNTVRQTYDKFCKIVTPDMEE
ncbi:MAG: cation:proton antiporter [Methanomassiliicoccales archaeon]|nr:cation:proton antiporter [Methanomassiliicoccales archaeon]